MKRRSWRVAAPGYRPFTLFSKKPIGRDEALATIRAKWPEAEIVE